MPTSGNVKNTFLTFLTCHKKGMLLFLLVWYFYYLQVKKVAYLSYNKLIKVKKVFLTFPDIGSPQLELMQLRGSPSADPYA